MMAGVPVVCSAAPIAAARMDVPGMLHGLVASWWTMLPAPCSIHRDPGQTRLSCSPQFSFTAVVPIQPPMSAPRRGTPSGCRYGWFGCMPLMWTGACKLIGKLELLSKSVFGCEALVISRDLDATFTVRFR